MTINYDQLPPIVVNILLRLKNELPKSLFYHSYKHTEEVIKEVELYAQTDNLTTHDRLILLVSAAFHDAGFLYKRGQNEDLAFKLAEMEMEKDGTFSKEDIREVEACILSTKIGIDFSRTTQSDLSKYLMDADLGNLGRADFFDQNDLLIKEMNFDRKKFMKRSLLLLDTHEWLTPAAKLLREEGKIANRKKLVEIISQS